jgi:hypothetical protein
MHWLQKLPIRLLVRAVPSVAKSSNLLFLFLDDPAELTAFKEEKGKPKPRGRKEQIPA